MGERLAFTFALTGRVFKIQKNICAILSKIISGKACAHDKRTKREKERPERASSPQPRATPWVSVHKHLRPVRAKVWANGWLLLLPLQGVGNGDMVPRALPWAGNLLGFQPAQGRRQGFFRTISTYLIFLDFEHPTFQGQLSPLYQSCFSLDLNALPFWALAAKVAKVTGAQPIRMSRGT